MKLTSAPPGRDVKGAVIKTAAALPHLIIASLLWLVFIAALPPTLGVGVTVLGASVLASLAVGVAEGPAVRILLAARQPTAEEARRLVVPLRLVAGWVDLSGMQLRVVAHGRRVDAVGRRHILLAQEVVDAYLAGRMTDRDVAALIVRGIGRLRWGRTRFDSACMLWTVPWDLICDLVVGTGRLLSWVPLGRFAWQTRVIVGAIAVVLETQAGRWPSAVIVAAFIAVTYLIPPWGRAWERHLAEQANRFASEHGVGVNAPPCDAQRIDSPLLVCATIPGGRSRASSDTSILGRWISEAGDTTTRASSRVVSNIRATRWPTSPRSTVHVKALPVSSRSVPTDSKPDL
jgi:hypothetical protein